MSENFNKQRVRKHDEIAWRLEFWSRYHFCIFSMYNNCQVFAFDFTKTFFFFLFRGFFCWILFLANLKIQLKCQGHQAMILIFFFLDKWTLSTSKMQTGAFKDSYVVFFFFVFLSFFFHIKVACQDKNLLSICSPFRECKLKNTP